MHSCKSDRYFNYEDHFFIKVWIIFLIYPTDKCLKLKNRFFVFNKGSTDRCLKIKT